MADLRITRENARFQQWEALLTNRSKRHRNREFLVQGVRPISRAVEEGWTVRALLRADGSVDVQATTPATINAANTFLSPGRSAPGRIPSNTKPVSNGRRIPRAAPTST